MNKTKVYLAQTDTTVGFLSSDDKKLSATKKRPTSQKMLQVVDSFRTLKQQTRIPKKFKKTVRNSVKTTFIYANNDSYRVVSQKSMHHTFIKKFKILYSTSANITQNSFDEKYARLNCDISVENALGYTECMPSEMYKISNQKIIKIR